MMSNYTSIKPLLITASVCFFLTACGGSNSSSTSAPSTTPEPNVQPPNVEPLPQPVEDKVAPGGLYLGYYQESFTLNPEDPTPGIVYLNIPQADGLFNGSMSFTYVGCQSEGIGNITGTKVNTQLNGEWLGRVDGRPQNGDYQLTYDVETQSYIGTYNVAAGKQHVVIQECIEYWIAPEGEMRLFPLNTLYVQGEDNSSVSGVNISNNIIGWGVAPDAELTVVSVISLEAAEQNLQSSMVWQELFPAEINSITLPVAVSSVLVGGQRYAISVTSVSQDSVVYSSNIEFIAN